MTMTPADRLSAGFGDDFADLSTLEPVQTPEQPAVQTRVKAPAPKPVAKAKTASSKPKPRLAKPRKTKPRPSADALAEAHGFTSREPAAPVLLKKRRRVQHSEPVDQLSIRGPVRVLNGFIDYCEANQLSYWEAMEQLVAQAR